MDDFEDNEKALEASEDNTGALAALKPVKPKLAGEVVEDAVAVDRTEALVAEGVVPAAAAFDVGTLDRGDVKAED